MAETTKKKARKKRSKKGEISDQEQYHLHKEAMMLRQREIARTGRDIAPYPEPEIVNPERKERCREDFRLFCEEYFPDAFYYDWSSDHLKVIAKIEVAVMDGGLFAMAMPRGSGKTTITEIAALWAVLYGYHEMIMLIGATSDAAMEMLESIKVEIETNERLEEDFREAVYPIKKLEGINQRSSGQIFDGERTNISWIGDQVIFPTAPDTKTDNEVWKSREGKSRCSGAIIRVTGITGRVRGAKYKRQDGRQVRPSLVIVDDPQTDESARSVMQCKKREDVLSGAVLGLAGPGEKISGIMPCTVIRPDDVADKILNKELNPEWSGERTKMVYRFPKNEKLWDEYAEIRAEELRADRGIKKATEFYKKNQKAMDEGSVVAWAQRYEKGEISALQHAMNIKLRDEAAFFAEYQNEPLPDEMPGELELSPEDIQQKINGLDRHTVGIGCQHLTAFIDIQQKLLYYMVCCWNEDFTGMIIDYGSYPDQKRPYFTLRDAKVTLAMKARGAGLEGSIYAGLDELVNELLEKSFVRTDGASMRVGQILIDANWGQSTDVVYEFCTQSKHSANLLPAHGRFVGASSVPFSERRRKPGDRVGHNWIIPNTIGKRAIRHVTYDTNYWKSFVHTRLAVRLGDKGCLSLWGERGDVHRMISEQITAEYPVMTEGRGRKVDEWKTRPDQPDNHGLDLLVGCAVSASVQGCILEGTQKDKQKPKARMSLAEIKRQMDEKRRNR